MTKKILVILAVALLIVLPLSGQSIIYGNGHGNGNGNGHGNDHGPGNGNGYGKGNGPMHNILEGIPFTYSGTVLSLGPLGNGMVITTAEGYITVQGLGPQSYWDNLGADKPDYGEQVIVHGYTVDFNGNIMNILIKVELNGITVELRDSETGAPLWRDKGNQPGRNGGGYGHYGIGLRYDILNGTPFSFAGDVIEVGVSLYSPRGDGITIATASSNVTVNGLGPQRYWYNLGIARPGIGDYVEVTGYQVDFNGNILNILMAITINGQTVQLRDPETGLPLWRFSGNSNN